MRLDWFGELIVAGVLIAYPLQPSTTLEEVMCIAEAVYFEARNQPLYGQYGVAHVIRNRVDHNGFPDSFCAVVTQPSQFSYRNDGAPLAAVGRNPDEMLALEWAMKIALHAVDDSLGSDFTYGATHFYNPDLAQPSWSRFGDTVGKLGDHKFINNMRNR